jgi:hypothetical protein
MDHSYDAPDGAFDGPARERGRLAAAPGMLALALVPVLAAGAFAGITLARATSGPPAEPGPVAVSSVAVVPVPPYQNTGSPTAPTPGTSPAPAPSTTPTVPGGDGGPGSGRGSGGGGTGGGGGGGAGGGGSGGGGQTTTAPPPPPPPPPGITAFGCGGRFQFTCTVQYQSPIAVQIRWTQYFVAVPAWDNLTTVRSACPAGDVVDVSVTVSSAGGSVSRSDSILCPDPEPPCNPICPIDPATDRQFGLAAGRERIG